MQVVSYVIKNVLLPGKCLNPLSELGLGELILFLSSLLEEVLVRLPVDLLPVEPLL